MGGNSQVFLPLLLFTMPAYGFFFCGNAIALHCITVETPLKSFTVYISVSDVRPAILKWCFYTSLSTSLTRKQHLEKASKGVLGMSSILFSYVQIFHLFQFISLLHQIERKPNTSPVTASVSIDPEHVPMFYLIYSLEP